MYSPCKTLEFEGLNSNLHPRTKFGNFQLGLHPQSSHGVFWSSLLLYVLLLVLLVLSNPKFWPGLPLRPWGQEFFFLLRLLLLLLLLKMAIQTWKKKKELIKRKVLLNPKFWPGLPLRPWGQKFLLLLLLLLTGGMSKHNWEIPLQSHLL